MPFHRQRSDYLTAMNWVAELMASIPLDRLGRPTPCAEFDVRTLMGHLIGTAERGLATAQQHGPRRHIPHVVTGIADQQLADRYAALITSIRSAWARLTSDDLVTAPWGECTALEAARGFTIETVTHGWDLAVAADLPTDAPHDIAQRCLPYAPQVIPERLRGVMYDQAVPTDTCASATERLAHLLGHKRP